MDEKTSVQLTDTECLDLMIQYPEAVSFAQLYGAEEIPAGWLFIPPDAKQGTLVSGPREGCQLLKEWVDANATPSS